jgi:hypothetical protein
MTMTTNSPRAARTARPIPLLLGLFLWAPLVSGGEHVKDYRPFSGLASLRRSHETLLVLRTFRQGRERRCLVLDPTSLKTSLRTAGELEIEAATRDVLEKRLGPTAYFGALRDAMANAAAVQNAGLTHLLASPPGIALTVDLCPSQKPLERGLFTELVREFGKEERPVPVAVAVTGVWMEAHAPDLEFLKELESSGDISITSTCVTVSGASAQPALTPEPKPITRTFAPIVGVSPLFTRRRKSRPAQTPGASSPAMPNLRLIQAPGAANTAL